MKRALAVAAWLLLASALRGESSTVRVQETAIIEIAGATAAYTTNPDIADVTVVSRGRLAVKGHSTGTTQLVAITAAGAQTFLITVAAPSLPSATRPASGDPQARYDGRYSGAAERVQNTIDVVTGEASSRSEFHLLHIHDLRAVSGETSDSIASIFYRHTTPGRVLTLLDDIVDLSRVTISNTQLRGLHLRQGPMELHGGYASSTMYDGFFLPSERRWAAGAGYGIDRGSTRWTPSVYGFFSEPAGTAARSGVVAALAAEHRRGDTLFMRGDVGVSRSLAASGQLRYFSSRGEFRAFLSLKPEDFPTLGLADIPGTHIELDLSRRATDRLSITSYGTYDRFDLAALPQEIGVARLGLQYALTSRLAVLGGADVSEVRTPTTSIRTTGVPLGLSYNAPGYGLAASYRTLQSSETSRRGDALRLNAYAGRGRFSASLWADRQRNAPTLDLIFRSEPGLELALLRLGIIVRNPEDVARALRDNAALIDLGFITGVNVDLTPRRLQAGFNLGWLGSGARNDHFRLVAIYGRDDGISSISDSMIATLSWNRRVLEATDLYASYSWWRTGLITAQQDGSSVDFGLRQQFSGLPRFLQRGGTIEGSAFLDPDMRGVTGPNTSPLPDITVTLDETRTALTDARGAYAFHKVPAGLHRIAAKLPSSPKAFFTTPSHSELNAPARIDFGLVWAAARIDGRVVSDTGAGMEGVVLSAAAENGPEISATSDAQGRFVFAVPPGTFRIALATTSIPSGYSTAGLHERIVTVQPDQPQSLSFEVPAIRSIAGRVSGATEVHIESLSRTAPVDPQGNFVFRSMPSGTFTIAARTGSRTLSQTITLPAEPAMMRDVALGPAPAAMASITRPSVSAGDTRKEVSPAMRKSVSGSHQGSFRVLVGAFRIPANTAAAKEQIERLGGRPSVTRRGSLDLVTVGPFSSREEARVEVDRLRSLGIDASLMADPSPSPKASPRSIAMHVVQTGAFRESRNAIELLGQLKDYGERAFSVAADGLTRVYIGPFNTRQEAVSAERRLRLEGFDGFVTRR